MKKKKTGSLPFIIIACIGVITAAAAFHGCGVGTYDTEVKPDSITVTPANASIITNSTKQFTATAKYADNTTADVTNSVTWSSSNATAATMSASGLATAGGSGGTATITAVGAGGASGSTSLTVLNLPLQSISVTPATKTIGLGANQPFTATGAYSDGITTVQQDITTTVAWSSSNTAAATIDANGVATGVANGTVTITATKDAKSGTATLQVSDTVATIESIALSPSSVTVKPGKTTQFIATATYTDKSHVNISSGQGTVWASSNTSAATVDDQNGVAKVPGTATPTSTTNITATKDGKTGTATLTVGSPIQ